MIDAREPASYNAWHLITSRAARAASGLDPLMSAETSLNSVNKRQTVELYYERIQSINQYSH